MEFLIGIVLIAIGVYMSKQSPKETKKEIKLSEKLQGEQVYWQREIAEIMALAVGNLENKIFIPDYYAEESGVYYNPATNKLKLAGPKTRLVSLQKLGYTEFIGQL